MVFSDLFFLFVFLPAFILLYTLGGVADKWLSRDRLHPVHYVKNIILVLFSLLFYAWGEPVYVLLMIVTVLVNYLTARWMVSTEHYRRTALIVGLTANIGVLGAFKYLGFFGKILSDIGIPVNLPEIGLPIGISFYVFQSISYLVDVYRNDSPVQRRYTDLLLYISMFPQLIAGPIVRYDTIAREINDRRVSGGRPCRRRVPLHDRPGQKGNHRQSAVGDCRPVPGQRTRLAVDRRRMDWSGSVHVPDLL